MSEVPERFEEEVEEVEAAVDEQVSDREPSGGIHLDNMVIILHHHDGGDLLLEVGSSDDESLPLINIPSNPVVLRVRKGALVIHKVVMLLLNMMMPMTTMILVQHLLLEIVRQDLNRVANGELLQLLTVPVVRHYQPPISRSPVLTILWEFFLHIFCLLFCTYFVYLVFEHILYFVFVFKLKM